jgi:phosphoglycolate phosphatase
LFALLIFDLDGTLIDSRQDIAVSVNLTLHDLGLPKLPEETIYGYVGNGVTRLIHDAVNSKDPDLLKEADQIFERHYLAHLTDQTCLYPGMETVLKRYKDIKKIVVTNKRAKFTRKIIENLGVTNQFELLISADEIGHLKPSPEMIFHALKRLEQSADETIMIGDMENDILAARAAGVSVCAVGYGFGEADRLR